MASSAVGSRELKTRLGTYLRRVREGRTFIVTDRGTPIAELRPVEPGTDAVEVKLARLNARGLITRQEAGPLSPFRPIRVPRRASGAQAIIEDREDRF